VRSLGDEAQQMLDVPLRKSTFRAILARVAVLCNERVPNSVSPYGGQGELAMGANPTVVFRVAFVNTPAAQKLELLAAELATESAQPQEVAQTPQDGVK